MDEVVDIVVNFDFRYVSAEARYKGEVIAQSQLDELQLPVGAVDAIFRIWAYLKYERQLFVSRLTAEEMLKRIGTAIPSENPVVYSVHGRHTPDGLPVTIEVTDVEIYTVVKGIIFDVGMSVKRFCDVGIPEAFRSFEQRLILQGEFSTLSRLDEALRVWTGLEVIVHSGLTS